MDVLSDGKVLIYIRARYCDPKHSRWLQRDPTGYADGYDLYEAFRGNSIARVDPHGTDDVIPEGDDLTHATTGFRWPFAKGISKNHVLIDHPEWPCAFIMTRQAATDTFDTGWLRDDFYDPLSMMQYLTTLATLCG